MASGLAMNRVACFRKHDPRLRQVVASAKGASRRSSPRTGRGGGSGPYGPAVPPNFDQDLEELQKGMMGGMMDRPLIPEGSFGPIPDLPIPTMEDLKKEGLLAKDGGVPEWIKNMQEAADAGDPDYKRVLEGTNNDPIKVIANINKEMQNKRDEIMNPEENPDSDEAKLMRVRFREVSHFNCWIWVRLKNEPAAKDQELVKEVFKAWYTMGRLSAYNGMNLQVFHNGAAETSYLDYDQGELETGLTACFHEMSEPEFNGNWCRVWVDLGTADEFSLDLLINSFSGFSREHCVVTDLVIGGENEDWPVPELRFDSIAASQAIPEGIDLAKFGIGGDPNERTGYELDEMDEITDIDQYLNGKNDDIW